MAFTAGQERFIDEYLANPANAAAAARRAGYSNRRARITASELLSKPDIKQQICRRQEAFSQALAVDRHLLSKYLLAICHSMDCETNQKILAIRELGHLHGLYP